MTTASDATRIRELNDRLRKTTEPLAALMMNGSLVITSSIAERGNAFIDACLAAVRRFDDFSEDNDPHHEHDMAFLDAHGERIFFKVDYYDRNLEWLSPDPADPGVTRRVLTIGLAEDY